MAIIHCKFKLGPQPLLPTILLSLNMNLEHSQTLTEPFFSITKIGKLVEKIH